MSPYFKQQTSAAPLAVFRMVLGLTMYAGVVRFWSKGWIQELYITPRFYFPYYGFELIRPLGQFTYVLFAICALSALMVMAGWYYRPAIVALFLSFTYIELMDKTTYLNHYYFVSLVCFLMIFLPAQVCFSVDAYRDRSKLAGWIPRWSLDCLKLLVVILYSYAGLAKLNSDWLLEALPLKIWLPARNDMPVIGFLFNFPWVAYAFSWFGCLYDLSIGFLLWYHRTRWVAYITVVFFHGMTAILFPIGMFPYMMMVAALVFFSAEFHQRIINAIGRVFRWPADFLQSQSAFSFSASGSRYRLAGLAVFFFLQLSIPFRYLLYPGELFWTEEGYRFSWRVMLMEKAGYTQFTVLDASGRRTVVNNQDFLSPLQEKMMSTQPDMILQYAHILRDHYKQQGFETPRVFVDSYVAMNGRLGKPLIDPEVDLAKEKESFRHKTWIYPLNDEIYGL